MAVDLAPVLVRGGSSLLFLALGAALFALAGDRRGGRGLALLFAGTGGGQAAANLLLAGGGAATIVAAAATYSVAWGGFVWATLAMTPSRRAGWALAVAWALATGAEIVASSQAGVAFEFYSQAIPDAAASLFSTVLAGSRGALVGVALLPAVLALAFSKEADPAARRLLARLAAGAAIFAGFAAGADALSGGAVVSYFTPLPFALLALGCILWLRAAAGSDDPRLARDAALALPAAALAGSAWVAITGWSAFTDPFGAAGLARAVAWALIASALVRAGWLDTRFVSRHRGAAAAGALASLFIVAQIAQNFLEARYGLLMGGIVAGAFLFAANPIQRALEGRSSTTSVPPASPQGVDTYRKALRLALHDGSMTREEEGHLADLAHDLGVSYRDALKLRDEVERELAEARAAREVT